MLGVEEAQEVFPLWLSHPLALGKKGPDLQTHLCPGGESADKRRGLGCLCSSPLKLVFNQ